MSSPTKDLVALAAGFAAGTISQDSLLDILGNDSLVDKVVSMAGGVAIGGVATSVARRALDLDPTGVIDSVTDIMDDVVGGIFDLF